MADYPTYRFCNPNNVSTNPNKPDYEGFGYCCPPGSTSANCQDGENGNTCTLNGLERQGEPLYKTYWVGMTEAVCNTTSYDLTVETTRSVQIANNFVIDERDAEHYEACHWSVSVEKEKYRDDTEAYIEVVIESLDNAIAFIYEGSDRHNVTAFIQANFTAVLGVPYRAPISANLIVVMMTEANGGAGSGSFSY